MGAGTNGLHDLNCSCIQSNDFPVLSFPDSSLTHRMLNILGVLSVGSTFIFQNFSSFGCFKNRKLANSIH